MVDNRRISDDVKILADACSLHNRNSGKIWIVAATLTMLVITSDVSSEQVINIFGLHINSQIFYPVSACLIGFLNIAYCSAHAQAYRTAEIFNEFVLGNPDNMNMISKNYSLSDACYSMVASNFNRIYPLTHILAHKLKGTFYVIAKTVTDIMFTTIPIIGFFVAIQRSNLSLGLTIAMWMLFAVSGFTTILLLLISFRWVFAREHALGRGGAKIGK